MSQPNEPTGATLPVITDGAEFFPPVARVRVRPARTNPHDAEGCVRCWAAPWRTVVEYDGIPLHLCRGCARTVRHQMQKEALRV